MKRTVTIIIALMAIGLLSVASSAQNFKFHFSEYSFDFDGSYDGVTLSATSVLSITKTEGEYYTVILTSQVLKPSVYDNVRLVQYFDEGELSEIIFAITDTHYLLIAFDKQPYGGAIEINPEKSNELIAVYANDLDDKEAQETFLKEFNRLKDYVITHYDKIKSKDKKAIPIGPVVNAKKTETSPKTTSQSQATRRLSIPGLPSEIKEIPYTELKTKVLRESKGDIQTGLIYSHTYSGINEPISVTGLMEHPLGIPSLDWESLSGEKKMFETLVKQGIGFEGLYKHTFDRRYSPSTALLLKKTLTLKPKVDFGTFSAVWRSYSDRPQMHLNYDGKSGEPSLYPSFTYTFKLSDMPSGYKMDKKKGLKAIKKSFENILDELRRNGFTVTKRKDFRDHYWFQKGNISGQMYLMINHYMVQYTEMAIVISNIGK